MEVVLHQKTAFEKVLAEYRPSDEAVALLTGIPLVIFLGVSGSGRNTIINHLIDTGKYSFIVSDTTRPPKIRDGAMEQDGVHYHFRKEEDMLSDLQAGMFLEAELIHGQQVSGISVRELQRVASSGKIPINEVDILGVENIVRIKPDTKLFFIVPPSYEIWLDRLRKRESMLDIEMQNRLATALRVLEYGLSNNKFSFIINDTSIESARQIDAEIHGGADTEHQAQARQAAQEIFAELQKKYA